MAGRYYEVVEAHDDWALLSPAGVRVKLFAASDHGSSEAAFKAASREATRRNTVIVERNKGR